MPSFARPLTEIAKYRSVWVTYSAVEEGDVLQLIRASPPSLCGKKHMVKNITTGMYTFSSMHQKVNDILTLIVIILSGYLILYPLWPEATYRFRPIKTDTMLLSVMPETNTLIIPKIGVNGEIYEGDENTLAKGIWHRPLSSTSTTSGNVVLAAHRFQYTRNTQTFYHLDKLTKGDEITLFWEGKVYKYAVQQIKEVNPHDITVEAPTEKPKLTLYTCTPLWIGNKRLVITAEPI